MRIILITGLLTFFIDQLSKYYVVFYLDLQNVLSINVIPPFLNFRMGWNTGINFGMLNQLFKSTEIFLIVLVEVTIGSMIMGAIGKNCRFNDQDGGLFRHELSIQCCF